MNLEGLHSDLITAPNGATAKGYIIAMNSKVNVNDITFDSAAKTYYNAINSNYNKIIELFDQLSSQLSGFTKYINEPALKKNFQKASKHCTGQARGTEKKKKLLQESFTYDEGRAAFRNLEEAVEQLTQKYNDLQSDYDSLKADVDSYRS